MLKKMLQWPETIKLLEENVREKLLDIDVSNDCFGYDTGITSNRSRNKQAGLHQTEKHMHGKRNKWSIKWKGNLGNGSKYLQVIFLIKGEYSKYIRIMQFNSK